MTRSTLGTALGLTSVIAATTIAVPPEHPDVFQIFGLVVGSFCVGGFAP